MKRAIPWAAGVLLLSGAAGAAEDYGMVMEIQGKATVTQASKSAPVTLGQTLFQGDRLALEPKSSLVVVAFESCDELLLEGPLQAEVSGGGIRSGAGNPAKPQRRLPVCYSQEELNSAGSGVIGGLVLRGAPRDPVAELRQDYLAGKASNASLMTLIMHDLANGRADQAAPYYQTLQQRAPDSRFVQEMRRHFVP